MRSTVIDLRTDNLKNDPLAQAMGPAVEESMRSPLELVYLSDRPPQPTQWLIGGLIPEESCLVLGAAQKTGKSWLAFHIALCLQTGKPVLGRWQPRRQGRVLIYSPESGWNARSQRVWGLAWGMGIEDPRVPLAGIPFIKGRIDLGEPKSFALLQQTVAAVRPALLIIDPLITAYADRDENAAGDVQPILNSARDLISFSPGMSVLVAHHLNKGAKEKGVFDGLRGSSALAAWADGLISLRKESDENDATRRVDVIHRDAASPDPIGFRIDSWPWEGQDRLAFSLVPCSAPGVSGPKSGRGKNTERSILGEIARHPGEYTAPMVSEKTKIGRSTVFDAVKALQVSNLVHKDRFGRLFPGASPESPDSPIGRSVQSSPPLGGGLGLGLDESGGAQ